MKNRLTQLSKNQKAIANFTKVIVGMIIFGVAAYADIQFILIMQKAFPDGVAKIFSLIGAVATGMSVLALVVAEAYWFSRGPQMVFGWIFTTLEVSVSVMNVILSFAMSSPGPLDPFLATWLAICPATPFVAFIGWIVILNLDEEQKNRHEERELQDDLATSTREHTKAVHEAKMVLKQRYLESTTAYLHQIADDPQVQAGLRAGAWNLAADELRALTGMAIALPQNALSPLPNAQTVESVPASQKQPETAPESKEMLPVPEKQGWLARLFGGSEEQPPALTRQEKYEIVQREIEHAAKHPQEIPTEAPTSPPALDYPYLPSTPRYVATEPLAPFVVAPLEMDHSNGNGAKN